MAKAIALPKAKKFQSNIIVTFITFIVLISSFYGFLMFTALRATEDHLMEMLLIKKVEQLQEQYNDLPGVHTEAEFAAWLEAVSVHLTPGMEIYPNGSALMPAEIKESGQIKGEIGDSDVYVLKQAFSETNTLVAIFDAAYISPDDRFDPIIIQVLIVTTFVILVFSIAISIFLGRRIAGPVKSLNKQIQTENPILPFLEEAREDELGELARTFSMMLERINGFLTREKQFTRHSSHELRTPIAIMRNSLSVLKLDGIQQDKKARNIERMERAIKEMEDLVETFLLLGREEEKRELNPEEVDIYALVLSSFEKFPEYGVRPKLKVIDSPQLKTNPIMLAILLENLVKNALRFTDRHCEVIIDASSLTIVNDISSDIQVELGYGLGLEIVERICERLGWQLRITRDQSFFSASLYFFSSDQ